MHRSISCITRLTGLALGAGVLLTAAGCSNTPSWGGWSTRPTVAQLQTARGIPADWVYYPAYATYYSPNHQQYVYLNDFYPDYPEWVASLQPRWPVTPEMLAASPTVALPFHDNPALHHATVVLNYPKNWLPPENIVASSHRN